MVSFGQSGMVEKLDMHKTFNPKAYFILDQVLWGHNLNREEFELSK